MISLLLATTCASPLLLLGPPAPIKVTSVAQADATTVLFLDAAQGAWQSLTPETAMLLVSTSQSPAPQGACVHLTSGEVLPGRVEESAAEDTLQWRHPWLGVLVINLDHVAAIGPQCVPQSSPDDILELHDGDRLQGFCVSIGPSLVFETQGAGGDVRVHTVPMPSIKQLHLAGAVQGPPVGCSAFTDGTVVRLDNLHIDADGLLQHAPWRDAKQSGVGATVATPLAIALGDACVPLGELSVRALDATTLPATMGAGVAGPLDLRPLRLQGEGRWAIALPSGMTRFNATVDVPLHLRHLAGGTLLVLVDGQPRQLIDLDSHTTESISVPIDGAKQLSFERTLGTHGEVGATVDLRHGVLTGTLTAP